MLALSLVQNCQAQAKRTDLSRTQVSSSLEVAEASLPDAPSVLVQQPQQPPPAAPPAETEAQRRTRIRDQAQRELEAEEQQRIGGVVPNFNVVLNGQAVPLTARQKYALAFHSITDPFPFASAALLAGYSEAEDSHKGFGHGPSGYFKRFGASYADNANGTLIGNAVLPALLHQDPRYFRRGTGTIPSRILYSALTTVICHGDNGRNQFNVSNVLGNFISGGISNAYYPADERGAVLTIENASVVTAEGTLGAQFLEFAPDLIGLLKKRHQSRAPRPAQAGSN